MPSTLNKFPLVFLYKYDGENGKTANSKLMLLPNPAEMVRNFSSPSKFRFVPLTSSGEIIEPKTTFASRAEFLREMRNSWKQVAIRCEKKGAFLSCRRGTKHVPGLGESALVEYRETIGPSESFAVQHFPENDFYSFRTWSGLYLSNHKTLGALSFRQESKKVGDSKEFRRTWEISPLLKFSSTEPHIKFVGVFNSSKKIVMKLRQSNNSNEDDKYYLDHAKDSVLGETRTRTESCLLNRGECTHFQITHASGRGDWHYYLRDRHGNVFMVVVSKDFSKALAGECVNDLRLLHKKYHASDISMDTDKKLSKHGLKRNETIQKELEFLVWNYNEQNESSRHHAVRKAICDEMERSIDRIVNNTQKSKRSQAERVRELNDSADAFRKNARKLRARRVSKWVVTGAVGGGVSGGAVGGLLGMMLWGPAGAAFFAAQSAKLGAFAIGSGVSMGEATCNMPLMWKKYVLLPSRC